MWQVQVNVQPASSSAPLDFHVVVAVFPLLLAVLCMCLMVGGGPIGPFCGGMPVDLPFAPHASFIPPADNQLEISVRRNGDIFIDTKWYPAPEFLEKMREFRQRASSKHVVIKADRLLSFGQLRSVLAAVRVAGFTNVSFITFTGSRAALIAKTAA